jgi:hypothetical protein
MSNKIKEGEAISPCLGKQGFLAKLVMKKNLKIYLL